MITGLKKAQVHAKKMVKVDPYDPKIPPYERIDLLEAPNINLGGNAVEDTPSMRFGVQIRLKRININCDHKEFANRIGIDIETLAAIEFGFASLDVIHTNLEPIAFGLGIPPGALFLFMDYLFDEKYEKNQDQL